MVVILDSFGVSRPSFIPAWASGRASMQELWGLSCDRVAVNVSRESMKVSSVDTSTESRVIGPTSGRGIRKDPGRACPCLSPGLLPSPWVCWSF